MRNIGWTDKNGLKIKEDDVLVANVSEIEEGTSNFLEMVDKARKKGASKLYLKFMPQDKFRLRYELTFEPEILNKDLGYDKEGYFKSEIEDAFFLRYLFKLDIFKKESNEEGRDIDFSKPYPVYKDFLTNTEYVYKVNDKILNRIPNEIRDRVKFLSLKLVSDDEFFTELKLFPLDQNKECFKYKDILEETPEDIDTNKFYQEDYDMVVAPFCDAPFRVFKEFVDILE